AIRHSLLAALPLHTEKSRTRTASARAGPRGPSGNKGSRAGGRVPASGARIGAARARSEGDCFPSLRRRARVCEEKTSVIRATRINFSLRLGPLASRSLSSVSGNPRAAGAEGEQVSLGRAGLLGWRGPCGTGPPDPTALAWESGGSAGLAAVPQPRSRGIPACPPALARRRISRALGPHVPARPARLGAAGAAPCGPASGSGSGSGCEREGGGPRRRDGRR
ncbi:hypothetical protein EI555_003467, partial [Monodon monoceros]